MIQPSTISRRPFSGEEEGNFIADVYDFVNQQIWGGETTNRPLSESVSSKQNPFTRKSNGGKTYTDGMGFEPTVRYERTHTFQA